MRRLFLMPKASSHAGPQRSDGASAIRTEIIPTGKTPCGKSPHSSKRFLRQKYSNEGIRNTSTVSLQWKHTNKYIKHQNVLDAKGDLCDGYWL
jgi:hypothetical protein